MPKYGNINERRNQLHEVIRLSGMNLIIDDTDHPLIIKVASIQAARMQVYFIDNDDYFQRKAAVCDENGNEFEDNDERSIFYSRGVLETVKKLRWIPDLIHFAQGKVSIKWRKIRNGRKKPRIPRIMSRNGLFRFSKSVQKRPAKNFDTSSFFNYTSL